MEKVIEMINSNSKMNRNPIPLHLNNIGNQLILESDELINDKRDANK